MVKEGFDKFPTTRFQGSKRKMLPWIYKNLKPLEFNSVLDAFGGTGAVSYLFKCMNKEVVYNDLLKFNYNVGKAIIENENTLLLDEEIDLLLNFNGLSSNTFIQRTFKEIYYLDEENLWLDQIISNINTRYSENIKEAGFKKAIAYFGLIQACLTKRPFNLFHRKNLYLRTTDVERNFGNKTTWDKPFEAQFRKFVKEANKAVINTNQKCKATNKHILEWSTNNYDLVYFDPPYLGNNGRSETINYQKCYHFLEGLVSYNIWSDLIDFESKNRKFKNEHCVNDFTKTKVADSIEIMFEKFQDSILVFSYKKGGVPTIGQIQNIMKKFKKRVYTRSMHYKYALNRQNGNAELNREVLIIGI